ncbi:hypothetical protein [Streptomyces galilaeus]|uniref:hypothetical protein n=1 Tax=Streptomyces galilaeus TaxID=33899 RepID=UPI0038F800F6
MTGPLSITHGYGESLLATGARQQCSCAARHSTRRPYGHAPQVARIREGAV